MPHQNVVAIINKYNHLYQKLITMKTFLFSILFISTQTYLYSQDNLIEQDWWKTFSGELNGKEISISINRGSDNKIVGSSCDLLADGKVTFAATEYGNNLRLTATFKDSIVGVFDGYLTRQEDDFFQGEYRPSNKEDSYPFTLKYSAGSYGTAEKRYIEFPGTDEGLETFATTIIKSFQTRDVVWLSQHAQYPLPVYLENKKQLTIKTPEEFRSKFDQIATETLLNKMTDWKTCNLFSNHSGVMLGRGEIWIWRENSATDQDPKYRIKDIVTH